MVVFDATIQSETTHMELCRALKVSQSSESTLRLAVTCIDLLSLGVPRASVLLDYADPQV